MNDDDSKFQRNRRQIATAYAGDNERRQHMTADSRLHVTVGEDSFSDSNRQQQIAAASEICRIGTEDEWRQQISAE